MGLKISRSKSKILQLNDKTNPLVVIDGNDLEQVKDFKHRGSIVTADGHVITEISAGRAMSSLVFQRMKNTEVTERFHVGITAIERVSLKYQICSSLRCANMKNE